MNTKQVKDIRGQVRQIAKELLSEEMVRAVKEAVMRQCNEILKENQEKIMKLLTSSLESIDKRTKDVQDIVVRQAFVHDDKTLVNGTSTEEFRPILPKA